MTRRLGWVVLASLLAVGAAAAQERPDRTRVWMGLGLGAAQAPELGDAFALDFQLAYQRGHHHVALRGMGLLEGGSGGGEVSEAAFLYGRAVTGRLGYAAVATGASMVQCRGVWGRPQCDGSTSLGLPVSAEAGIRLGPILGLGLRVFADVNEPAPLWGVTTFLQLGWMP